MTDIDLTSTTLTRRELRLARELAAAERAGSVSHPTADGDPSAAAVPVAPARDTAREEASVPPQERVVTGADVPGAEPRLPSVAPSATRAPEPAPDPSAAGAPTSTRASDDEAGEQSKPKERSLLAYLANALIGAVLIAVLGIGVAAIVVPAATGSTALTVMTGSMEPTLPPGTMVVVKPTAPEDIREGMVLTYQLHSGEPTLVTHRVTERYQLSTGEYEWVTQGDANPSPDVDRVREVQVKGTVWYAIPYLGWVSSGLTGEWRLWLIPVAVVVLFGYAGWMFVGGLRERSKRRGAR